MRGFLVYNPNSGRFPSRILAERAAQLLSKQGWRIELERALSGPHITQLAAQAAKEGADAFFIAGGDGSVNLAMSGLLNTHTALGVLPSGTANVFAQELALPGLSWTRWLALEESAMRLANAEVHRVDVGFCNQRPFLLWAGVGLDAFVVHRLEPRDKWEKNFSMVQYVTTVVWEASSWHGMNLRTIADGRQVFGHYLLAVITNIRLYAGGLAKLSPNALMDDGIMDLWLFRGGNLGDTVQHAWDLIAGRHVQSDQVVCLPFRKIHLESESPVYTQVDGEPDMESASITIEVHPKALRVLVPDSAPASLFRSRGQSLGSVV